jgi:glycosyltransferase involved in cell wall biosynthesis
MKLSIVVPAYNEEKLLPETLRCIRRAAAAFEPLGWEVELIVCDNNSSDRTAELARAAGATVVFEPVNQIARARNTGAAAATGDWLLFIDADSQPSPELFGDLASVIKQNRCLGGGCTLHLVGGPKAVARLAGIWNAISRLSGWVAGSFVFCDAGAFRQLGGFSLQLYASEEIEFSRRLKCLARKNGKRIVILNQHPMVTSGRKIELYSVWDYLAFLGKTVWRRGRTLRSREHCHMWYDGRR